MDSGGEAKMGDEDTLGIMSHAGKRSEGPSRSQWVFSCDTRAHTADARLAQEALFVHALGPSQRYWMCT